MPSYLGKWVMQRHFLDCLDIFINETFIMLQFHPIFTIDMIYWVPQKLPQIYILQITQPSQYRCTQLRYRFVVISEAPSIITVFYWLVCCPCLPLLTGCRYFNQLHFLLTRYTEHSVNCMSKMFWSLLYSMLQVTT